MVLKPEGSKQANGAVSSGTGYSFATTTMASNIRANITFP